MIRGKPDSFIYHHLDIDKMHRQALNLWEGVLGDPWSGALRKYDKKEKAENERAILQLIKKMEESKSKEKTRNILEGFLLEGPLFSPEGKEIFRDPGFFRSSEDFITKVRNYDPEIAKEEIGQAFRNVWIMNLLQKSFEIPVECTEGVFGYSMLYPYTDNFMDDPGIEKKEKYLACDRVHRRLLGNREQAEKTEEAKIYDMIEKIEATFSRELHPGVFESLLYIHHSQRESLRQQSSPLGENIWKNELRTEPQETELQEKPLLEISFHKGGASVLADGYLVKGTLNEEERIFCFNYGVLLQMADDLQDCKEDYENRHRTLFSLDYGKKTLDNGADRLIGFAEKVFDMYFANKEGMRMNYFLMENTLLLILGSVLMNPAAFSEAYVHRAEIHFPVSQKFLEIQQEGLKEKLKNQEQRGVKDSLEIW